MTQAREIPPSKRTRQTPSAAARTDTIGSLSFQSLLFTQWLTAINDNAFRWLVVGIGKNMLPSQTGFILAAGLACFVLPFLFLAAFSGYLADRFAKRDVIIVCKIAEILIMSLGIVAIIQGDLTFLLIVVALMGAQSALFAPAKMGTIPELLASDQMSVANGWFGFSTVTATVIGMMIGNWLADVTGPLGQDNVMLSGVVLIGLAVIGTALSIGIRRVPAASPHLRFPWNAFHKTMRDLASLYSNRALFWVAGGIVFFWSLGALAQLNIDQFANESGAFHQSERTPLLFSLVLGVGIGSVLAGIWSGGRIELGMLSVAAAGIAFFSMSLMFVGDKMFHQESLITGPLLWAAGLLTLLGISAGIFDVPLAAYIQHRSPVGSRGSLLSAANFMIFSGILLAALFFYVLRLPYHPGLLDNVPKNLASADQLTADQRVEVERRLSIFIGDWERYRQESAEPETSDDRNDAEGANDHDSKPPNADNSQRNANASVAAQTVSTTEFAKASNQQSTTAPTTSLPNTDDPDTLEQPVSATAKNSDRPSFTNYLSDAEPAIRNWLIARLLWEELQFRHQDGEQPAKSAYLKLCNTDPALEPSDKMLIKAVYEQSDRLPLFTSRQVFFVIGMIAIPICGFVTWKLPQASSRFMIWWFFQAWFHVEVKGLKNLPDRNPVILLVERDSWFHRLLILLVTARRVRVVTWEAESERAFKRRWNRFWGVIHIHGGPASVQTAMADARKTIRGGNVLAVFPEGEPARRPAHRDSGERTFDKDEWLRQAKAEAELKTSPKLERWPLEILKVVEGLQVPLLPVRMNEIECITRNQGRSPWAIVGGIATGVRSHVEVEFETPRAKPQQAEDLNRLLEGVADDQAG